MMMHGIPEPEQIAPSTPEDRWGAAGRSPATAAVIALLGIGAFYFFVQIVFTIGGVIASVHDVGELMALRDSLGTSLDGFDLFVNPLRWAVMLSQYLALLLPTALLVRAWHTRSVRSYVRLQRAPVREIALAVIGTVLIIPVGVLLTNLLRSTTAEPSDVEKLTEKIFTAHSAPEFVFLVFVVAVTPAICEEFFFRGYIQRTFERVLGSRSVMMVGVIFGLFHMQPAGLLTLSMIGVWLGYVYFRSRSMLPNMAAHFTNNFIALWLAYQAPVVFGVNLQDDAQLPIAWSVISILLLGVVVWLYHRSTAARATDTDLPHPLP